MSESTKRKEGMYRGRTRRAHRSVGDLSSAEALRNPGWWIAFAGTLAIALLAMTPPLLGDGSREIVMAMFSGVCHQLPGRSPHVDGVQLAVCHRCAGIYWGLPAAALLFTLSRPGASISRQGAPLLLIAAATPAGVDWALDVVGVLANTPASRIATGVIFGLGAGWFLVRATTEAGSGKKVGSGNPPDTNAGRNA